MKTTDHSLFTWSLAHLIHPFIWAAASVYINEELPVEGLKPLIGFSVVSVVVSLPSLPAYWSLNRWIIEMKLKPNEKFLLWLFVAPVITTATAFVFMFIMGGLLVFAYGDELVLFALPAIIATFLSVLIRYPQFIKLTNQSNDK